MRAHRCRVLAFALVSLFLTLRVSADGKGEGGVVLEDIPIYPRPDAIEAMTYLKKSQPVAAIRSVGLNLLGAGQYVFDEKQGRVQVFFFPSEDPTRGKFYHGWIDAGKVAKFFYECSCGKKEGDCDPIVTRGLRLSFMWNSCFMEAWERKISDMEARNAAMPSNQEGVEERLQKLDELLKKKLITKEEYDRKRAEIINNF